MSDADTIIAATGHPLELRDALLDRVQAGGVKGFSEILDDWVDLMWSLDAFRVAGVVPPQMGVKSLDALNRKKGDWFAELIAALLQNWTSQPLGARSKILGFSQAHQIDVAWPERRVDPLICIETKVMGAPGTQTIPARAARDDWSNRRKEVKFAATDLKLFRRAQETSIHHWNEWREKAPPQTYILWAARMEPGRDVMERMIREVRSLVDTYLDGAGIVAWQPIIDAPGYQPVDLPPSARVHTLDDVLHRISSQIKGMIGPDGKAPRAETPSGK